MLTVDPEGPSFEVPVAGWWLVVVNSDCWEWLVVVGSGCERLWVVVKDCAWLFVVVTICGVCT